VINPTPLLYTHTGAGTQLKVFTILKPQFWTALAGYQIEK
jgi:hypothetical protein